MVHADLPPPLVRVPAHLPTGDRPLAGKRVGVYWSWFQDVVPPVQAACRTALVDLENAGAEVSADWQHEGLGIESRESPPACQPGSTLVARVKALLILLVRVVWAVALFNLLACSVHARVF